jgi:Mrp family chromosome partitioning ATPase
MKEEKCKEDTTCDVCKKADTCAEEEKQSHEQKLLEKNMEGVRFKFLVLSGKGGVGKSTVTVNLATTLSMEGAGVGILDADIHGPNIPMMLGIESVRPFTSSEGFIPVLAAHEIRVMSIGFLLRSKDDAVIWRGPLKHGLLKQFLGEVLWGDLDYLIFDLPPGTGDEALSISHLLKRVDGAIVVTTPQDVALLDSRKSITFCQRLNIPLIGVIENMSGMICPHCQKEIDLFKKGGGEKAARDMGVPFLGRIPLDPGMVDSTDTGRPFVSSHPQSQVAEAFRSIAANWEKLLKERTSSRSSFFKKAGSA